MGNEDICSILARELKWAVSLPSYKKGLVPIKALMLEEMVGVTQSVCVGYFLLVSFSNILCKRSCVELARESLLAEIENNIALLRDAVSGLQVLNPG